MLGLFEKKPTYEVRLIPLRKCWCGSDSFGFLRVDDAIHCNECGAFYLIRHVSNPVARVVRVETPTPGRASTAGTQGE